ncbi:MAG: hypothetical protein MZV64_29595 [Ignavibacteriales bacterium]|nr:hypothetical protein [Ignavibacteriales bacterium]
MTTPFRSIPIVTEKIGTAWRKFVVPSSGSMTQRNSAGSRWPLLFFREDRMGREALPDPPDDHLLGSAIDLRHEVTDPLPSSSRPVSLSRRLRPGTSPLRAASTAT